METFPVTINCMKQQGTVSCYSSRETIVSYDSLCDVQFKTKAFSIKLEFQETDFVKLVSSVYDPPKVSRLLTR
jgi:hypothetical protein